MVGQYQNNDAKKQKKTKHQSLLVFLTDDCDAPCFGHLDHFVHQALCALGKVFPLKHTDWAVPHDLLGATHGLGKGLGALWSTVQTLRTIQEHYHNLKKKTVVKEKLHIDYFACRLQPVRWCVLLF